MRRQKVRLDYLVLHREGRKVIKREEGIEMDQDLRVEELKILDSLNFHLTLNSVDELKSEEECRGAASTISDLYINYRRVHVALKSQLGDEEYTQAYPGVSDKNDEVTKYLKSVKSLLRDKSSAREKSKSDDEFQRLIYEFQCISAKVGHYNDSFNSDPFCFHDDSVCDTYAVKMGEFINEIFSLSTKMRCLDPTRYENQCRDVFERDILEIQRDITLSSNLKRELSGFKKKFSKWENLKKSQSDALVSAKSLKTEISLRFKSLSKKFDLVLNDLGDYQILEVNQDKSLESEFNSILEKVTELTALSVVGGPDVEKMVRSVVRTRDRLASKKDKFFENLQKIVLERDVTVEKLKNGADMLLELPKFSGYDSEMDFFTFKSQFRKLVEERVSKKHLADYLKHNYLSGQALLLVSKETDYSKIWDRLSESFGNARILLQNKLALIDGFGSLSHIKGKEKLVQTLAGIVNVMRDLGTLAREHDIEGQLYEGGGLEKLLFLIGETRHRRFRVETLGHPYTKMQQWQKLKVFLEKELQLNEMLLLDRKTAQSMGIEVSIKNSDSGRTNSQGGKNTAHTSLVSDSPCHVCGQVGHTQITTARGKLILPYYVCELFVRMSPAERLANLESKNLCTVCLFPGAVKGPQHKCYYTNFCCPSHDKNKKIHVLLCETHKKNFVNQELLAKFKERFLTKCKITLPKFTDSLALFSCTASLHSATTGPDLNRVGKFTGRPDVTDPPIFELQTISISGTDEDGNSVTVTLNLFFDNGASDCIIRKSAIQKLLRIGRAEQVSSDPFSLSGVADHVTICKDGFWRIILPLHSGENAILSGLCLPKITSDFPTYTLTDVVQDVQGRINALGRPELAAAIPNFSTNVGGGTDILLGSRYKRYFPKEVYEFEDGLSILKSVFLGIDGTRGVFNGAHKGFAPTSGTHFTSAAAYFTPAVNDYHRMRSRDSPLEEKPSLPNYDMVDPFCCDNADPDMGTSRANFCGNHSLCMATKRTPKNVKRFEEIEAAGTEVTYRCVDCRGCKKCLSGPISESMSIQEEHEQSLIDKCVNVDSDLGITMAKLPFILDPDTHLVDNEHVALRVYQSQLKILNDRPDDKKSVLLFEQKLHDMGCVDYVENLEASQRDLILGNPPRYFIPWRPAWSESPTTPCRLVFDASMSAKGGCSLNSILAKGCNSLNNLQAITIRWMTHKHAFHTDVQKMYNKVLLDPSHWRYQLYLFSPDLNPNVPPQWKVIKTLIYGVRPSGGLAESGLRKTVELCNEKFPLAYEPIMEDTYMDDCASGTECSDQSARVMDEIECAVSTGGFSLKGFTVSGEDPLEHLSTDGISITVLGLKWFPKGDFIKLNIGDLNFNKKLRGRKRPDNVGVIPDRLTLRQCVSRVSEVYDPVGRVAPVLAGLKLDISTLHKRCVGWDDPIPSELKEIWLRNFNLISELADVEYHRAVVPSDAVSLDMETIDTADAGEHLVCSAVYVRFLRKDGTYSSQLIFARSKIIHDVTTPRAELIAAVLNASTGHIVRTALKKFHKTSWHVTDSQVALIWICSPKAALKDFVRNRKIEINRLTKIENWYYTNRQNMIADLGTHKGVKIEQVSPGSPWIDGLPWMRERKENFPLQTVGDIVLSSKEQADVNKEKFANELTPQAISAYTSVPKEVGDRYKFSKYLVNPCRFRYRKVLRIVALVFLFLERISAKVAARRKKAFEFLETGAKEHANTFIVNTVTVRNVSKVVVVPLPDYILRAAKNYYFRKATSEILKFVDPKKFTKISTMKDGILYFSSRILFTQKVDGNLSFTDAVLDLTEATFFVPLVDAHSPIAYALVLETHWFDPDVSHSGVESTLRYAQNTAHIIGGRELVKKVRKGCIKCRLLHRQGLKIAMGPISDESLKIAPVFYYSQTDICGPFKAFSPANKRATLNIYFVVFCCTVTGAVDCRVMEDYTTDSFVLAFDRFSCRFGYPKMLMPDEGSQLVKACKDMILSFSDLSHQLSTEYGVEFKTCPVGAHYVHGKVERKIQEIKRSLEKNFPSGRRSILQWETLGQQVSNSINNLPIGLGNKVQDLETLDILTPNRLILGRNNCRGPVTPLSITNDFRRIIQSNNDIYNSWFKEWLISYVPTLVRQPKWFESERHIRIGDVVLFCKSDKEFENVYQYGIVVTTFEGKDGLIRVVEVQYHNFNERVKRTTKRCVRELIVVHPVDELGIQAELDDFAKLG